MFFALFFIEADLLIGQFTQSVKSDPSIQNIAPERYAYDAFGNLSAKDGKVFVNDGWQISSVKNSDGGTECASSISDQIPYRMRNEV